MANIISTQETRTSNRSVWRRRMVWVVVVLVVAGAAVGGYIWKTSPQPTKTLTQAELDKRRALAADYDRVSGRTAGGSYEEAAASLESAVARREGNEDKAFGFIQLSVLAGNNKKYQEAYDYATQSEKLSPTAASAQRMAEMAAKLGRKDDAIASYKLAISRITSNDEASEADRNALRAAIKNLGGTP